MLFQVCKISDLKRGRSHCHYLIMRFNGRIKSRFFVSVDQIRHLHPHPRSSHAAPIPPDTSITTVCETETLASCTASSRRSSLVLFHTPLFSSRPQKCCKSYSGKGNYAMDAWILEKVCHSIISAAFFAENFPPNRGWSSLFFTCIYHPGDRGRDHHTGEVMGPPR